MSQSPHQVVASDVAADYTNAWDQITRWTEEGRGWSGHERNSFFLNTKDGRFADASSVFGWDCADDGRGIATTDWDHDGDLDVWTTARSAPRVRLLRNDYVTDANRKASHFLSVKLAGVTDNRDAVGARIVVELQKHGKATRLTKTIRAGEGFLSQHSKRIHFGLGDHDAKVDVTIRWPSGETQTYQDLLPDNHYDFVQGQAQATAWIRPSPATA